MYGTTRRGIGVALILEIFTDKEDDILHFVSYVAKNLNQLRFVILFLNHGFVIYFKFPSFSSYRTCYSLPLPDHIWVWTPHEFSNSNPAQTLVNTCKDNPNFYNFSCIFLERQPDLPKSKL